MITLKQAYARRRVLKGILAVRHDAETAAARDMIDNGEAMNASSALDDMINQSSNEERL